MSHMFCTLREAAQTLNASEDQIKALLERGLLQEFRQGPHRLLREADVGALALKQRELRERPSPTAPSQDHRVKTSRPAETGLPHSVMAGPRLPQQPGSPEGQRRRRQRGMIVPGRGGMPYTDARGAYPHRAQETGPRRPDRRPSDRLSVRQWFWMGLVQDRPVAIALLSGLVFALVAALGAGLWCLTQVQ